jgi:hypothetical protein
MSGDFAISNSVRGVPMERAWWLNFRLLVFFFFVTVPVLGNAFVQLLPVWRYRSKLNFMTLKLRNLPRIPIELFDVRRKCANMRTLCAAIGSLYLRNRLTTSTDVIPVGVIIDRVVHICRRTPRPSDVSNNCDHDLAGIYWENFQFSSLLSSNTSMRAQCQLKRDSPVGMHVALLIALNHGQT